MNIVIVESAAKAKTINKYLGSDYKVIASIGHVRDLPSQNGSVCLLNSRRLLALFITVNQMFALILSVALRYVFHFVMYHFVFSSQCYRRFVYICMWVFGNNHYREGRLHQSGI